ncbi:Protein TIC110, chloroplastic [Olea europaea subsp. europaea]|uniref:Protein TIC110, chloroplastic n=1 Tax=Olea europaea subsp. europaea TaxID=158383 RepID=A0A8S0PGY7_OLEEU|nr:Protein TIC110, chloroplastic [Olea europaea subsp. europaea]
MVLPNRMRRSIQSFVIYIADLYLLCFLPEEKILKAVKLKPSSNLRTRWALMTQMQRPCTWKQRIETGDRDADIEQR